MATMKVRLSALKTFLNEYSVDCKAIFQLCYEISQDGARQINEIQRVSDSLRAQVVSAEQICDCLERKCASLDNQLTDAQCREDEYRKEAESIRNNPIPIQKTDADGNPYTDYVINHAALYAAEDKCRQVGIELEQISEQLTVAKSNFDFGNSRLTWFTRLYDWINGLSERMQEDLLYINKNIDKLDEQINHNFTCLDSVQVKIETYLNAKQMFLIPGTVLERKNVEIGGDCGNNSDSSPTNKSSRFSKDCVTYQTLSGDTVSRTVYHNNSLDPFLLIPKGTKCPGGRVLERDMTNLELMKDGNAPFIPVIDGEGETAYSSVELHHLSGLETIRGKDFYGAEGEKGGLVEISSAEHKKYSRVLHIPKKRGESFRNTPADNVSYNSFRSWYWKNRAEEFERDNQ